jgi:hypothetical protein
MSKTDNYEQLKSEYISAYEMVNKKPCPEIVKVKAWIKVGEISYRPDDFEKSLRNLQLRCSNKGEERREIESKLSLDLELLNQTKDTLRQTLDRLKKLTICDGIEIENMTEMLEKCENLVEVSKKRNII